jgi:hypothetical protein
MKSFAFPVLGNQNKITKHPMGTRGSFCGGKAAGVLKLHTHLLLVSRLGMRGAITPLPQYTSMA